MHTSTSLRWLVVAVSAAMLLAVAAACTETVEVPGETVFIEKEVIKEVQVPGETVVVEKIVTETVEVPGETVVVEKEVVKTVEVPGETVVVEKVVVKEVAGKNYVTDPTTGKTVTAPQYGGTLNVHGATGHTGNALDSQLGYPSLTDGVIESPGIVNWGVNRSVWDLQTLFTPPKSTA